MTDRHTIENWLRGLQDRICQSLEDADGKGKFQEDHWERPGGGGGRTRIFKDGNIIEKGGVNFSAVWGEAPANLVKALEVEGNEFLATGVSIVMHPNNPHVPIIHMNVRYFEMDNGTYWFGGGIDLTPHFVIKEDAKWFHEQLKAVCDKHDASFYPRFKKWADDYFYIRHREETRGVGGIFFDRISDKQESLNKEQLWAFVQDVGDAFARIYTHFMKKYHEMPVTEDEKEWQRLRRGRYVEFNLVWDRGTKFGLDTNGRTESILMSLPPLASWEYAHTPQPGSREAETLSLLKKGIDWVNID
ncbi:oxygen-dependent coproporphyrinogen oxidase [Limibacter armeniacum]|uniref:oxygen-dependent coproporphyrinogen oxidase n=1 Tax=Limibacter armeniacum TaxID=466084 RepID=UPI002FE649DD